MQPSKYFKHTHGQGTMFILKNCFAGCTQQTGMCRDSFVPHHMPVSLSGDIKAVGIHHLVPGLNEIIHEFLLRVITAVDFRQGPEL